MRKETELPSGLKWPDNKEYKWFAVDKNDECYFFIERPRIADDGYWVAGGASFAASIRDLSKNWQKSLQYRYEEAETPTPDERPIHRYIIYPKGGTPYTTSWVMELETPAIIFDKANDTYSRDFGATWYEMESDHL